MCYFIMNGEKGLQTVWKHIAVVIKILDKSALQMLK